VGVGQLFRHGVQVVGQGRVDVAVAQLPVQLRQPHWHVAQQGVELLLLTLDGGFGLLEPGVGRGHAGGEHPPVDHDEGEDAADLGQQPDQALCVREERHFGQTSEDAGGRKAAVAGFVRPQVAPDMGDARDRMEAGEQPSECEEQQGRLGLGFMGQGGAQRDDGQQHITDCP